VKAVNLIPVERRVGASVGLGRSQGGAYAVIALVGLLALLVFVYGKASHQVTSDNAQAAKLTTEAEQVRSDAGALARYNGLIVQSEARTAAAEGLMDSRFDWAHALHEVGRVLPSQVSIATLNGTVGAAEASKKAAPSSSSSSGSSSSGTSSSASTSVTSATPPGSVPTVVVTGCATSQTVVAEMLQRLRLIEGVKEATLTSSVSAAGSNSGSTTCPSPNPTFTANVTFEPLPATIPSSTTNVSNPATPAGASAGSTGSSK
jgi:Tfp pilus assembly protein PilN